MSVVGIDLGTTNTVVGCVRAGKVHVLADEKGARLLPSVVSFHPNGEVLVGGAARARRVIDAPNTVYSHKRLIGRSWGSPEIGRARQSFPFELREGPGQGPLVHARGQDYTLPEISAFVLKRARQIAEQALGTPIERAVITVPAHFNELQRASTKVAGRISGLEVLRILNEPTAAALAYGLGRSGNERVAVYDFGGGTFDCTLLDLNGNVFEVLATAGDSFLGGDDIDAIIADRMAEAFLKQHRQDAKQDAQMFERLKTTAEDIKIALSTTESHTVTLKDFGHGAGGAALHFQFTMTRKDLEALLAPLIDRTFKVTQDALTLARLSPTSFDKIILVGGSTRAPLVRQRVESFFGTPPMDRVNPDEVVAIGAAIQAAALTEDSRRRNIPAPPAVPRRHGDGHVNAQTSALDPAKRAPAASLPDGEFGAVADLSFVSTTGAAAPRTSTGEFGHVSDLSLIAHDTVSPGTEAATQARGPNLAGGDFDDATEKYDRGAKQPPHTLAMDRSAQDDPTAGPIAGHVNDDHGARIDRADLPAVVAKAKPARNAGPPGHEERRAMLGRPPPLVAPQPFGPMEKHEEPPPSVRTVTMPSLHRRPAPVAPPPSPQRSPAPNTTQPMAQTFGADPKAAPGKRPVAVTQTLASAGVQPPPATTFAITQTQPLPQQRPLDAPPPPAAAFVPTHTQPLPQQPPHDASTFGAEHTQLLPPQSAHDAQAAWQSPYAASQPPIFGAFPSLPPPQSGSLPLDYPPDAFAPNAGAALAPPQGASNQAPVLVDVTPRGLVVETAGGYTDTIIARNSKIPCERTRRFATGHDMQTSVRVRVGQGESTSFPQNTYLGEVELSGLRPAPRGEVTVAVTFEVDADGTLRVRARDVQTGQEARATLQLVGVADESSVVMMISRFANQPVVGGSS